MATVTFQQADQWRQSGQLHEACEAFRVLWEQQGSSAAAWRYLYCLRKLGRHVDAQVAMEKALEQFPDDRYVQSEAAWIIYYMKFIPAARQEDLTAVLEAAERIGQLDKDAFLLPRTVLTVMKTAKKRGNWPVVLAWANRLSADKLGAEPRVVQGKQIMPDRQIWYINRTRAMLEVGQYAEARQAALEALAVYPNCLFLKRLAALALAGLGQVAGAIEEMRRLVADPRAAWYMRAELAELEHRAGNVQEAYRVMSTALLQTRQSGQYKLTYFVSFARIALALDKPDVAAAHLTLARQIRAQQGWKIPQALQEAEQQVRQYFQQRNLVWPNLPAKPEDLERVCRRSWQEGSREGMTLYKGTVKPFPQGRPFCYIRRDDGQGDVYALVADLPGESRRPGSRVEFAIITAFDKKKQQPSLRATCIRALPAN